MAQRKLLLDTNANLRLARSIHPLLFVDFGEDRTRLYVTEDFGREFARSRRLRSKFPWVDEPEYRDNRQIRPQIGRKQKRAIRTAIDFIGDQADHRGRQASSHIELTGRGRRVAPGCFSAP